MVDELNNTLNRIHANEEIKNEALKNTFNEILNYLNTNYKTHFDSTQRHYAGVALAAFQLEATLGVFFDFFIYNVKSNDLLLKHMEINGLVKADQMDEIAKMGKKMRNSPLYAEVTNQKIKEDLAHELTSGHANGAIKDEIAKYARKKHININEENLEKLTDKILKAFINEINKIKTCDITGPRGRVALARSFGAAAAIELAGDSGVLNSISVMPKRSDDKLVEEMIQEILHDRETDQLMEECAGSENSKSILSHSEFPINVLRLGKGLDSSFVKFAKNPEKLFKLALKSLIIESTSTPEQQIENKFLKSFILHLGSNKGEIQRIIGAIPVTFNQATNQTMPLAEFANKKSVASIMYENNLRTICSISGTTLGVTIGITLGMGIKDTRTFLKPLFDYSQKFLSPPPHPLPTLNTPEGQKFKQFFTELSFFMQAGQYHTAAEVLGSLFVASRAYLSSDDVYLNIDQTFTMFEGLMKEFGSHPENFLSMRLEDAEKINRKMPQVMGRLKTAEFERIMMRQQNL